MRKLPKGPPPQVLTENKETWDRMLEEDPTENNKNRYRHPDIKAALLSETHHKCAYCESKIGHNCPGDIEHKIPKVKKPELIFNWDNMTIACNECNRRKLDYYDPNCTFLDPNVDEVERLIFHFGPVVFNVPGDPRSEVTVRVLELNGSTRRKELIGRKLEKLEDIKHLADRIAVEKIPILKEILLEDLSERCSLSAEFSGMAKAFVVGIPGDWNMI